MRQRLVLATCAIAVVMLAGACGTGGSRQAGDASSSAGSAPPSTPSTPSSGSPSASSSAGGTAEEPSTSPKKRPTDDRGQGRIATKCDADHVAAKVRPSDAGAGNRHAWLVLTNTSSTTCTVYGYGGMQLYDGDGHEVPTDLVRVRSVSPATLSVGPGESVRSLLRWSAVPHEGDRTEGTCQPEPSIARVTPPDETHTVGTGWSLGAVCDAGRILQRPYQGTKVKAGE